FPLRGSSSANTLPPSPAVGRPMGGGLPHNPSPPQQQQPPNPDALPSHPTPVRPGLMADSMVSVTKPPPVRHYANASPAPMPQNMPPPSTAPSQPVEEPVTTEEIERLRMMVKADASDQETAMRFAKRLVEAADILIPNVADPK